MTAPASYDYYQATVQESRDEGLLMIAPAGADGDDNEVVRWSSPSGERVVEWIAVARGGPPEVPSAQPVVTGHVLLRSFVSAAFPLPTLSGGGLWVMLGTYTYGETAPREVDSKVILGNFPPLVNKVGDERINDIPAAQFLATLLSNGASSAASTLQRLLNLGP